MAGTVIAVCISAERGTAKQDVGEGYFKEDFGLEGDGHAGSPRQVSMLMGESVARFTREHGLEPKPGDFAENILTRGIDLKKVKVGMRLQVGDGILEIVQIGKEVKPHHYSFHGFRLLPTEGLFCRVLKSGRVKVGDPVKILNDTPETQS
ncbi:MAG: MOSC domain-containing protein [Bacillota bacterium]